MIVSFHRNKSIVFLKKKIDDDFCWTFKDLSFLPTGLGRVDDIFIRSMMTLFILDCALMVL